MKKIALGVMLLLTFTSFISLNAQWARTYGGAASYGLPLSIQQTRDGGYIVAGTTNPLASGDYDFFDFWVLKVDKSGCIEWQRSYGGSKMERNCYIRQTNDGGYILTGGTTSFGAGGSDIWIVKLNSVGDILWQWTYGGNSGDSSSYIQQTNNGGYIVVGSTSSLGAGRSDIWILKLNSTGGIEWQRTYGGSDRDYGSFIQQTKDGGYIVGGSTYSFGAGGIDIWVLKLNSAGDIVWQRTYGRGNQDWFSQIQQTNDGGYVVVGYTKASPTEYYDFVVLKLNSAGGLEWQQTYGGKNQDMYPQIQQTNDGGYVVVGTSYLPEDPTWEYADILILKLFSDGRIDWQHSFDGGRAEDAHSIQQTNDGAYIVGCDTNSFGAELGALMILKLSSDGDIDPSCEFMRSSDFEIFNINIAYNDTEISPKDSSISPQVTNVSPQETDAVQNLHCLGTLDVDIDIKPGSFPNVINLGSGGNVPVAILSSSCFDATTVDPTTITLASASVMLKGKGTPMASFEDVNGDGLMDIVVHVETSALQLSETDTEALLEGKTLNGVQIRGIDTVRVIQ